MKLWYNLFVSVTKEEKIEKIKAYFKLAFNIKRTLIIQVILFVLISAFSLVFSNYRENFHNASKIRVGLANLDESAASNILIDQFKNTEHFSDLFEVIDIKKEKLNSKLENSEIDAYIILPDGFAKSLYNYENLPIILKSSPYNPVKNEILKTIFEGFSEYVKATDLATYSYYNSLKKSGVKNEEIRSKNRELTVKMLNATIARAKYFKREINSNMPALSSLEYFLLALPVSLLGIFTIRIAVFNFDFQRNSAYKRFILGGVSSIKLSLITYLAEFINYSIVIFPLILFIAFKNNIFFALNTFMLLSVYFVLNVSIMKVIARVMPSKIAISFFASFLSFFLALFSAGLVPYMLLPDFIKSVSRYMPAYHIVRNALMQSVDSSIFYIIIAFISLFFLDILLDAKRVEKNVYI